jgi:glycine/D-amino acid oxidase-like deaminating enzyme
LAQAPRRRVAEQLSSPDVVVVGAGLAGCAGARFLAESGASVVLVDSGSIGAGASGRNGGFLFRQPAPWINELLAESLGIYRELEDEVGIPFDLQPWPMLLLAVEEGELEHARSYAAAAGATEIDLRGDPWFADVIEGGFTLDAMGATTAMAESARQRGVEVRPGCEAKRILTRGGRVRGLATDDGVISTERVLLATGPRLRFLARTAGVDLPVTASRGWLLETGRVDPPPQYAIEQAAWPVQEEMGALVGAPTLSELASGGADEPGLVSLLLGGRPGGHCLIGTSLRRSLLEEPETPETVRRLAERAVRVSPILRDVPVVAAWSGRRAVSPDGMPLVGPVPGVEGLEVAGAFSSIGMVTIPASCRRLVHGGAEDLHPGRFA